MLDGIAGFAVDAPRDGDLLNVNRIGKQQHGARLNRLSRFYRARPLSPSNPTISRRRSASEIFSSRARRFIMSLVIVALSVRLIGLATKTYRRIGDDHRLVAVATAGYLPAAPTPPHGTRPCGAIG